MKMEGLEIEKLKRAFEAFSSASEQLSRYYKRLEDRVRALSAELQVKNRLLEGVFSCMREPLMVVDSTGKVVLFNARAKSLFGDTLKEGTYFEELGIAFGQEIKISDGWFIPERFKLDEQTEVVLLKDITLIKEMEQERQKLKRLEAMGQALATVVHELRNPLCSIELYAS
ncbi:MAG: PAS domain-containing protein, partial [Nitrospirae bacterium]